MFHDMLDTLKDFEIERKESNAVIILFNDKKLESKYFKYKIYVEEYDEMWKLLIKFLQHNVMNTNNLV